MADAAQAAFERNSLFRDPTTLTALSGVGKSLPDLTPKGMQRLVVEALKILPEGTKIGSKAFAKGLLPIVGAAIIFAEAIGDTQRNWAQLRESGAGVVSATLLASFTAALGTFNSIVALPFPLVGWGTSELSNYFENQLFNWMKGSVGKDRSLFDYTDIGALKSIYLSIFAPDTGTVEHIIDAQTLERGFIAETPDGMTAVRGDNT